jgi:hypothetical protein
MEANGLRETYGSGSLLDLCCLLSVYGTVHHRSDPGILYPSNGLYALLWNTCSAAACALFCLEIISPAVYLFPSAYRS